jgi:protein ImuB
MAFGCIFVPNFMVQAVVRWEPALRDRAVALVDGTAPVWGVVEVNEAASKAGIELGMTKSQAQQFCDIEIRHRSRAQEKAAHAALMDLGWSVSPRIEDTAPDTIVLDLAGLNSLFGSDEKIARQLAERALSLGLSTQIAAASKIDVAIIAARGFNGITVIPEGEERKLLRSLPICVLFPSLETSFKSGFARRGGQASTNPETRETLERWGVRTCEALAALPVLQLSERLGQEGVRLHELARAQSERSMTLAEPEIHFEEEMELEDAVEELEPLSFLLGRLLDQLCARLDTRSLAACAVRVRFELDPGFEDFGDRTSGVKTPDEKRSFMSELKLRPPKNQPHLNSGPRIYERVLSLPVPMRDSKMLLKLLRLHLQSDAPAAPILKIMLAADAARPRFAQGGLFLPSSPDPEKLELTVARLANLVGDSHIGSPELMDTHRPGEFRMRRFVPPRDAAETRRQPHRMARAETRNPKPKTGFRVFRTAPAAKVELRDGCPVRVGFQGLGGHVVAASGPWRSSGDWWREDGWNNDEWDIEIEFFSAHESRVSSTLETQVIPAHEKRVSPAMEVPADAVFSLKLTQQSSNRSAKNLNAQISPRRGFYRVFYDAIRQAWFVRGAYD